MYLAFYTLSYILQVIGAATMGASIWMVSVKSVFVEFIHFLKPYYDTARDYTEPEFLQKYCHVFIYLGAAMFIVSFLGYIAACSESKTLIIIYSLIVIVILTLQIVAASLMQFFSNQSSSSLPALLSKTTLAYRLGLTDPDVHRVWDKLNNHYQCCGKENHSDFKVSLEDMPWYNQSWVPDSCCKHGHNCTNNHNDDTSNYNKGCENVLEHMIKNHRNLLLFLGIGVSLVELIFLGIACFIFCNTRHGVCTCRPDGTMRSNCKLHRFKPTSCRQRCPKLVEKPPIIKCVRPCISEKTFKAPSMTFSKTKCHEKDNRAMSFRVPSRTTVEVHGQPNRMVVCNQVCKSSGDCPLPKMSQCSLRMKSAVPKVNSCLQPTECPDIPLCCPPTSNIRNLTRDRCCLERELEGREFHLMYQRERMLQEQKLHNREQLLWEHEQFRTQHLLKRETQFKFKAHQMTIEQDIQNRDLRIRTDNELTLWETEMSVQDALTSRAKQDLLLTRGLINNKEDDDLKRRMEIYCKYLLAKPVTCEVASPGLSVSSQDNRRRTSKIGSCGTSVTHAPVVERSSMPLPQIRKKNQGKPRKILHARNPSKRYRSGHCKGVIQAVETSNHIPSTSGLTKIRSKERIINQHAPTSSDVEHTVIHREITEGSDPVTDNIKLNIVDNMNDSTDLAHSICNCDGSFKPKYFPKNAYICKDRSSKGYQYYVCAEPQNSYDNAYRTNGKTKQGNVNMPGFIFQHNDNNETLTRPPSSKWTGASNTTSNNLSRKGTFKRHKQLTNDACNSGTKRQPPVSVQPITITSNPSYCDCECHLDSARSGSTYCDFCDCDCFNKFE